MEQYRKLERVVRGFSNHRRIQILALLRQSPGLTVAEVSDRLKLNFKTASEHLRRLALPGLVQKRSRAASVEHRLTPLGEQVLRFLQTLG